MDKAPDQLNTLALWREAGRWWQCEPYLEVRRYVDAKGIIREAQTELPTLGAIETKTIAYDEDQSEEWSLKIRKTRDEKVAKACGQFPKETPPPRYHQVASPYAVLHAISGYAFGRGTMLAQEIPALAAARGAPAALLADPFSLTGAVEFCRAANPAALNR